MRELSQHVLDLIENSQEAGASSIQLDIIENARLNLLRIRIVDDGRGMDQETLAKVVDPFFTTRTTRRVGLGIPLLKAAAERCGGGFVIESVVGGGTLVEATFELDHIDRAPLGDMVSTLMGALLSDRCRDLRYTHQVNAEQFIFDTREIREILGDVPLSQPQVRQWVHGYIREGIESLYENAQVGAL